MKDVTAIIISFLRLEYTMECIRSLREQYEGIHILVAENGKYDKKLAEFVHSQRGHYMLMPFDSGVCYARNRVMELVRTKYVLVGDDDFFYTKEAGVDRMKKFLEANTEATLIGGRIRERGELRNYQGNIEIGDGYFHYHPFDPEASKYREDEESGIFYEWVDITFNYFLARTKEIKAIPWDEKIKVAYEHSDWFISLKKAGKKVAFTPDAIVVHKPEHVQIADEGRYKVYRHRRTDKVHFFRKHKIKYSIGFNGTKTVFDDTRPMRNKIERTDEIPGKKAYTMDTRFSFDGKTYNRGEIVITSHPAPGMTEVQMNSRMRVDNLPKGRK